MHAEHSSIVWTWHNEVGVSVLSATNALKYCLSIGYSFNSTGVGLSDIKKNCIVDYTLALILTMSQSFIDNATAARVTYNVDVLGR